MHEVDEDGYCRMSDLKPEQCGGCQGVEEPGGEVTVAETTLVIW